MQVRCRTDGAVALFVCCPESRCKGCAGLVFVLVRSRGMQAAGLDVRVSGSVFPFFILGSLSEFGMSWKVSVKSILVGCQIGYASGRLQG